MKKLLVACILPALLMGFTACSEEEAPPPPPPPPADIIFHGGAIITVDEDIPSAEAVAVRDGLILAVGSDVEVLPTRGDATRMVDLEGQALLPGFIDAHGHLAMMANTATYANVASPPVGPAVTIADLQAILAKAAETRVDGLEDWILGIGYDDSLLAEQRHPTRYELDAVADDRPILLIHVSGHLAATNSVALEHAGINADTEDPEGGHIRRVEGSMEPNGVLEEAAMFGAFAALPATTREQQIKGLRKALQTYAANGITTAQDGFSQAGDLELLRDAAAQDALIMDVVSYPGFPTAEDVIGETPVGTYDGRLKIGGVKLMLDGSPQGKTAYLSAPYHVPPAGQNAEYRGYPAHQDDAVDAQVDQFYALGWPIIAHANGDAAAEQLINAVEKAEAAHPGGDRRTVMIHAQTVRDDQLDRMAPLGMIPSFFVAHTFFWGDWHRDSVLGTKRAYRISPAATAGKKGVTYTFHNDAPVVPPHMTRLIWTGVNRRTRTGDILGPAERVSPTEAIKAVTINAAYQHFEEAQKGSISPGKRADLVILSDNPLTVDPLDIEKIAVVETFKDGQSIYRNSVD